MYLTILSLISTSTQSLFTGPHSDFFLTGYYLPQFRLSSCLCLSALLQAGIFFLLTCCWLFLFYPQRVFLLFQTMFSSSYILGSDGCRIFQPVLRSELCSPEPPEGSSFFLLRLNVFLIPFF